MSAAGQTTPSQPASGWYPSLDGLNLPRALTNGVQQGFSLIYSLRDTVNQLQTTVSRMVQYGTHSDRTQTKAQATPDGALWFETDRATVFYQARFNINSSVREWFYAGGIMYDTLANRPAAPDLGANDVGFLFLASGGNQLYRWNGTGWTLA